MVAALGAALRLLWAIKRPGWASGEAGNVALAIAGGRGFADPYHLGQGPTAHLLPTTPLFAGGVYAALGAHSPASEAVLFTVATALVIGSPLLLWRAFGRLGTPAWARTLALGYVCLLSPYLTDEVYSFRIWEGALAAFLAAAMLNMLIELDQSGSENGWRRNMPLPLAGALMFFVQPVLGIGCYVASAALVLRRERFLTWLKIGALGALALMIFIVPWTIRNLEVMGKAIPLRSNAGLELSYSMYPGAVSPGPDPKETFFARMREVHPRDSAAAYQHMQQAGGEIRYSQLLGDQARAWMRAHPGDAFRLTLRHLHDTYVPPEWITRLENERLIRVRTLVADVAGILGLLGLGFAVARRRRAWIYPAIITVLPTLLFSLFQPIPRYEYLFFGLLSFAGADFVSSLTRMAFNRRDREASTTSALVI